MRLIGFLGVALIVVLGVAGCTGAKPSPTMQRSPSPTATSVSTTTITPPTTWPPATSPPTTPRSLTVLQLPALSIADVGHVTLALDYQAVVSGTKPARFAPDDPQPRGRCRPRLATPGRLREGGSRPGEVPRRTAVPVDAHPGPHRRCRVPGAAPGAGWRPREHRRGRAPTGSFRVPRRGGSRARTHRSGGHSSRSGIDRSPDDAPRNATGGLRLRPRLRLRRPERRRHLRGHLHQGPRPGRPLDRPRARRPLPAELDTFYRRLVAIGIVGYPALFDPKSGDPNIETMQTPYESYYLRLHVGGRDLAVAWADQHVSRDPKAVALRNLCRDIAAAMEAKPEVQALPHANGGYA